jgi:hypothetical protein
MVRVENPCSVEPTGIENHGRSQSHSHNQSRRLYWNDSFTPRRTGSSCGVVPAR